MTDYPDFSPNNYQIISELGRNNIGGRVTYLAEQTTTKQQVVIKQFQFAKMGATWAEYDAYSQEIEMLRHLDHPGIPKYLDSFQTADGFCMVQEYINAQSLAVSRSWSPKEIKKVAVAILEILVYLQSLNPSVIHRDIKPENILVDENLNIYLVDFGFARLGGGEIAASSVVKGTMGFMPPEQLFNRELTTASDLYGLGATLICLLTGIISADLGNYVDENYQIKFQHLVPPLKQELISWLEKISQPNPKQRYADAAKALAVLKFLDVDRLPKVRVNRTNLKFFPQNLREKVTETITISNSIPETILTGRWEVEPHPSDPPHTPYDHAWIEFDYYQFEGNNFECKITVDTSKLLAGESYKRELLLHSNSGEESLAIPILVVTPPLLKTPSYLLLLSLIIPGVVLFIFSLIPLRNILIFTVIMLVVLSAVTQSFNIVTIFILVPITQIMLAAPQSVFFVLISLIFANRMVMTAKEEDTFVKNKGEEKSSAIPFENVFTERKIKQKYINQIFIYSIPNSLCLLCWLMFFAEPLVTAEVGKFQIFVSAIFLLIVTDVITVIWIKILKLSFAKVNDNLVENSILIFLLIYGLLLLLLLLSGLTNKMIALIAALFGIATVLAGLLSVVCTLMIRLKFLWVDSKKVTHENKKINKLVFLGFGFSVCMFLAYSLLQKVDSFPLTSSEEILVILVAFTPILFFGWPLAKRMVKYGRSLARYNREKPNLIKP